MIEDEVQAREFVAQLCDETAMERLDTLSVMLTEENGRQNLVAKASLQSVWQRHIADSAQLLNHVPRETTGPWLDLGTGAGFPGLVIAIMRPDWDIRLVESRRRRGEWLEHVCTELWLDHCHVIGSRLEHVEDFSADVISARAFAPMLRLLDLSARFSTDSTIWLLPKGRSAAQELQGLPESKRKLFHVEQSCTDEGAGIIVGQLQQKARR